MSQKRDDLVDTLLFYNGTSLQTTCNTTVEKVHMEASKVGVTQVGDRQLFHSLRWSTNTFYVYLSCTSHMLFSLLHYLCNTILKSHPFFLAVSPETTYRCQSTMPKHQERVPGTHLRGARTTTRTMLQDLPWRYTRYYFNLNMFFERVFIFLKTVYK